MPTVDLDTLTLKSGSHSPPANGLVDACVMEAVAYVANEPWSDHPACASPVITSFLISWNDAMGDTDRQMLKPFIPRLVGTRTTPADEQTRAWMLTDWLARECAPAFLRTAGLTDAAELLETLAPITSTATARKGQAALDNAVELSAAAWAAALDAALDAAWDAARAAARDAAWDAARAATWDAARAATWDATRAAARAAARDAARAAARDAARAAAWDAARDAARDATWDAARAATWDATWAAATERLAPPVKACQASALLLLDRMIEVGR